MLEKFRSKQFVSFIKKQVQGKKYTLSGSLMGFPEVNIAVTEEEKEKIFHFRYKRYVQELDRKIEIADHKNQIIKDKLDKTAINLYIDNDYGEILGVMRLNFSHETEFSNHIQEMFDFDFIVKQFGQERFALMTGTLIAKNSNNFLTPAVLNSFFYCYCRENNIPFAISWCEPCLVKFFSKLGFYRYRKDLVINDTGARVPLILVADDISHMEKIKSPFLPFASEYSYDPAHQNWFKKRFTEDFNSINEESVDSIEFWNYFQGCLQGYSSLLFQSLSDSEIQDLIQSQKISNYSSQKIILKEGDEGDSFFVILKGSVEIYRIHNKKKYSLRILGKGDLFGEMAFLCNEKRGANIIALEKTEILVLSPKKLQILGEKKPKIANTIMTNIARILALRLRAEGDAKISSKESKFSWEFPSLP